MLSFNPSETRTALSLSLVFFTRMTGLFVMLPILPLLATELDGATPLLIGLAMGIYGLFQALLQIPFGALSDRLGRKRIIIIGLALFVAGCLVAANAESIWGIIVGRAMQGMGAVSAVVMALAADLCREEMRTRMMALLGASIGLSFIVSIVLGPALSAWLNLASIFIVIAVLGCIAAAALWWVVPQPLKRRRDSDVQFSTGMVAGMLRDGQLLRLDAGIFLLHLLITGCFVIIPQKIIAAGYTLPEHWLVYLIAVAVSLIIVLPMVGAGERKLGVRPTLLMAIAGLAIALLLLAFGADVRAGLFAGLALFFGFLSVLEALLPSLVSRLAPAAARGTAMGIYSTSQFLGAFAGGLLSGWLLQISEANTALLLLGCVCCCWIPIAWGIDEVGRLGRFRLAVPQLSSLQQSDLLKQLSDLSGVREVSMPAGNRIAYMKIDRDLFSEEEARALLAVQQNKLIQI